MNKTNRSERATLVVTIAAALGLLVVLMAMAPQSSGHHQWIDTHSFEHPADHQLDRLVFQVAQRADIPR